MTIWEKLPERSMNGFFFSAEHQAVEADLLSDSAVC
jgi:hypothetical protein